MPGRAPTSTRYGQAVSVCPACPAPFMTGTGCSGRLCPGRSSAGLAVTLATLPQLGQAPAPSLNEKRQPQKHATSVIVDTFLSLRPLRCGLPVTAAGPGFAGALPVWLLMRGAAIPGAARAAVARLRAWTGAGYGLASNTALNGVSLARRKRVRPARVTTSRIAASPAWAPSASPTSCDSDAGVHSRVEKP
jgi:hypothetical protein